MLGNTVQVYRADASVGGTVMGMKTIPGSSRATAGTCVGPSAATLLNILNISPFTYGMTVAQIYDRGNVFSPEVLDISTDELVNRFLTGITTVAAISLTLNYPTSPIPS
ncbi:hypothetical protein EI94DRAFT_1716337 [Lactarius quietus]|nr:hypothetical protein EI94DRAFT_1716337 [Lactarius quietus]